jgi:transketolase
LLSADQAEARRFGALRARLEQLAPAGAAPVLREIANSVRGDDLQMVYRAGLGHLGGDFSVADILVTLYAAVLNVDPMRPLLAERDRLVLSKGHTAGALYATLARFGFFARHELDTFAAPQSALNGHPSRTKVPGVETSTGPLGHGFPVAVGMALSARLQASPRRVFVVLGDGELQEGSNWEAAMTASHYGLSSLFAVVDRNRLQQGARTEETKQLEPLAEKWASFGWEVREVNGHDHAQLLGTFRQLGTARPVCVIAHTVKGKGVSFMEDRVEWHHKVPSAEQVEGALQELSA